MAFIHLSDSNNGNVFPCPHCFEITRCVRVPASEVLAKLNEKTGSKLASITELFGLGGIPTTILGIKYWKCCSCGTITIRKNDGRCMRTLDEFDEYKDR